MRRESSVHPGEGPAALVGRRYRRRLAFLRLVMATVSCFLALEVGLRVLVNRSFTAETEAPLVPSATPDLGFELAANYSKNGVRTDARALRWRPPDATPAAHTVLVIGDSIAFGSGVPYERSFAPLLEARLSQSTGRRVAVWNAAVPGYNTVQQAIQLRLKGPAIKPDLIVVQFCLNDYLDPPRLTPGGTLDATRIDGDSGLSLLGLAYRSRVFVFTKEKVKDLQKARPEWFPRWSHYARYIHRKPGWERARAALLSIQRTAREFDAQLLVVVFPLEPQLRIDEREAQDDLVAFARAHRIPLLDLFDTFQARWREGLYVDFWLQALQYDKLHLNERGHALTAQAINAHLVSGGAFGATGQRAGETRWRP